MGKLVILILHLGPCPTSCDVADFSIRVVSEEFMGQVRFCESLGAWPISDVLGRL